MGGNETTVRPLGGTSSLPWIVLGLAIGYVAFFIWPVFLSGESMHLPAPVPAITPIGTDLRQTLNAAKAWLARGGSPYAAPVWYPPLAYLLLKPLIALPISLRYPVVTTLSMLAYVGASLIFPLRVARGRHSSSELILIFTTGLISYGLLFEIERGQLNIIAAGLVFLAVWLHRQHVRGYIWAYLVLTIAIQLKLWPVLFVPIFTQYLGSLRRILFHVGALGAINAALLFMLSPAAAADLLRLLQHQGGGLEMIWIGNHSIHSFMSQLGDRAALRGWQWIASNAGVLEWMLVLCVIALLIVVMIATGHRQRSYVNSDLLMACTLAALLLPVQSNDYKLVILVGPAAIFLSSLRTRLDAIARPTFAQIGTTIFSLAYSVTLFPISLRPQNLVLANACPALLVMLLVTTTLSLFLPNRDEPLEQPKQNPPPGLTSLVSMSE